MSTAQVSIDIIYSGLNRGFRCGLFNGLGIRGGFDPSGALLDGLSIALCELADEVHWGFDAIDHSVCRMESRANMLTQHEFRH